MQYKEIPRLKREEVVTRLQGDNVDAKVEAILSAALYDGDYHWVQTQCIQLMNSNNANLQHATVTAIGHVARIHKTIDKASVIPELEKLHANPPLKGTIEDTLDDIKMFVK